MKVCQMRNRVVKPTAAKTVGKGCSMVIAWSGLIKGQGASNHSIAIFAQPLGMLWPP